MQQCFCGPAGRYRRPQATAFVEQVKALSASARSVARRSQDPEPQAYIECIEPPPGKPHLAGLRRPVFVWPPSRQTDPAYVLACAQHAATEHTRLYAGRWIVLHHAPAQNPNTTSPWSLGGEDDVVDPGGIGTLRSGAILDVVPGEYAVAGCDGERDLLPV